MAHHGHHKHHGHKKAHKHDAEQEAEDAARERRNRNLKRAGLAAAVLLAPGGFILGATLATNYYRKRRKQAAEAADD